MTARADIITAYDAMTIDELENELYTLRFEAHTLSFGDDEIALRIALAEIAAARLNESV